MTLSRRGGSQWATTPCRCAQVGHSWGLHFCLPASRGSYFYKHRLHPHMAYTPSQPADHLAGRLLSDCLV